MTENELKIFFPFNENDDLDDLFEERLFEFKQFFIQKTIIPKVFEAKINKLLKIEQAYNIIKNNHQQKFSITIKVENSFDIEQNILTVFNRYQIQKNDIKSKLQQSQSTVEIIQNVRALILLNKFYLDKWVDVPTDNEIVISRETDPMELLKAIKEFNLKGGVNFVDISEKINICPDILIFESKRLSLQRNLY
jgi:hypothetical protein